MIYGFGPYTFIKFYPDDGRRTKVETYSSLL